MWSRCRIHSAPVSLHGDLRIVFDSESFISNPATARLIICKPDIDGAVDHTPPQNPEVVVVVRRRRWPSDSTADRPTSICRPLRHPRRRDRVSDETRIFGSSQREADRRAVPCNDRNSPCPMSMRLEELRFQFSAEPDRSSFARLLALAKIEPLVIHIESHLHYPPGLYIADILCHASAAECRCADVLIYVTRGSDLRLAKLRKKNRVLHTADISQAPTQVSNAEQVFHVGP